MRSNMVSLECCRSASEANLTSDDRKRFAPQIQHQPLRSQWAADTSRTRPTRRRQGRLQQCGTLCLAHRVEATAIVPQGHLLLAIISDGYSGARPWHDWGPPATCVARTTPRALGHVSCWENPASQGSFRPTTLTNTAGQRRFQECRLQQSTGLTGHTGTMMGCYGSGGLASHGELLHGKRAARGIIAGALVAACYGFFAQLFPLPLLPCEAPLTLRPLLGPR